MAQKASRWQGCVRSLQNGLEIFDKKSRLLPSLVLSYFPSHAENNNKERESTDSRSYFVNEINLSNCLFSLGIKDMELTHIKEYLC